MAKYGIQYAKVDTAASGNTAVVAAVTGKKISVYQYTLVASGAVTAKWRTASTDLTGGMAIAANGTVSAVGGFPDQPLLQTVAGEALNLNLGGAVQVSGHIAYTTEAP